nr:MAG TPA: interact CLIP, MHC2 interacting [Caudoviricetes sp.]
MSSLFIAFGFISFVMFLYTVYSQAQQIKALKKTVRRQRHLLKFASDQPAQDHDDVEKQLEEDWAEIEKLFRHRSTMK